MNKKIAFLLPILLMLAHCGGKPYAKKSLRKLNRKPDYVETQHDVMLRVKELSYKETKSLFSGLGSALMSKHPRPHDIQPILISVHNNSNKSWVFAEQDINLSQVAPEVLYERMRLSPAGRATVGTVLTVGAAGYVGIIGTGAIVLGVASGIVGLLPLIPATLGLAILTGGSIGTSNWAKYAEKTNSALKEEITEKIISPESDITIPVQSISSKLIFSRFKHIPPQFKIVLENELNPTEKLTYYVDLDQNNNE